MRTAANGSFAEALAAFAADLTALRIAQGKPALQDLLHITDALPAGTEQAIGDAIDICRTTSRFA